MASSSSAISLLLLSCALLSFLSASLAAKPHALLLPVKKDRYTRQYIARLYNRDPLVPLSLVVDLGGRYAWVDCDTKYASYSYRPVHCDTPECGLVQTPFGCGECGPPYRPGCSNQSCSVMPESPTVSSPGELAQDLFAFGATDGYNPGPVVITKNFIFSCAPASLLQGLARSASGMAGLGRNRVAMPIQLAVEFRLRPKFAICLSSSTASDGVIFFGDGPYGLLPNFEASKALIYTPLIINNVSTAGTSVGGERSVEHFIGLKAIKVNDKAVPLDTALLAIDRDGVGGTKISTVAPFTVLETSIYKAVTEAFDAAVSKKSKKVAPLAPFELCYDASAIGSTRVGPAVPAIDLVLQGENYWRIVGANSMVEAAPGVLCLGFVDGGVNPRTSIVIGGHQIEDNLLQFDLSNLRLGFSSSLLFHQTTCANFNFTASTVMGGSEDYGLIKET